ncbi:hypothetical protein KR018_003918, partial [Drosophila ironensis]
RLFEGPETWIEESRAFALSVITDTLREVLLNTDKMSEAESIEIRQVRRIWQRKLMERNPMPESNRRTLTPPPSPPRSRHKNRERPGAATVPADASVETADQNDVDDYEMVMCPLFIPPNRRRQRGRWFNVLMPALVVKKKILEPFLNADLLRRVMDASDEEGTNILQQFVADVLQRKRA